MQGRASDGGVILACALERAISENKLNIPLPRLLPGTAERFPYVILGDEAFPLKSYLTRQYHRRAFTYKKKVISYVSLAAKIKYYYGHLGSFTQQSLVLASCRF